MLVIFTTTPNEAEAEHLATQLLDQRLAACVQILPKMKSFYFWKNKIQIDSEYLLLIKTGSDKYQEVESVIISHHSYETPEIVAIKAQNVSDKYLQWINNFVNI